MCSEEFLITWNDHRSNMVGGFQRFLNESSLVDCTITAEGQYLKAHRLVLSACSPYFEVQFSQKTEKNTIFTLKDIKFEDLKSLITFVYQGCVTVPKDKLPGLVRAAKSLQIKGLSSDFLNHNLERGTCELSVVCRKESSALHVSPKCIRMCSATYEERSGAQCVHLNTSSTEDAETSVEIKVEVEDTPFWESEDESTNAMFSPTASATAGEENQNVTTPVVGTFGCDSATLPHNSEKESKIPVLKFSSASDTISTAEDAGEFAVHGLLCPGGETLVKSEPGSPVRLYSHSESLERQKDEMNMEDSLSWKNKKKSAGTATADIQNLGNTNHELDTSAVSCDNQHAVWFAPTFTTFTTCNASQYNEKEENAQIVNIEEAQMKEQEVVCKCESVDINEHTVGNVVQRGQHDGVDEVDQEELDEVQKIMVGVVENALLADYAVEQHETDEEMEDATPLSIHIAKMSGRKSHKCPECPNVFRTVNCLQVHIKMLHRKEPVIRCEMCLATFAFHSEFLIHRRKHTGERSFQCEECEMSFTHKSNLTRHMQKHTGERPFQCDVCRMSFRRRSHLTTHMHRHTGEYPFQCDLCKLSFRQSPQLIKHMQKHNREDSFLCDVCQTCFSDRSTFTTHVQKHCEVPPFQCDLCKSFFKNKRNLTRHMWKHTGERPFQCDVCKMFFGQSSHLITHMRKHTGEHPFSCNVCEMTFIDKSSLTAHMRKHTDERSFQCDVCEMSFRLSSHLTRHMRKHTGERPFKCNVCELSFSQSNNLNTHMRIHTGERPFQCDVCKMSFSHSVSLTRHKRKHSD